MVVFKDTSNWGGGMNDTLDLGSTSATSEHLLSLTGSSITMTAQLPQVTARLLLLEQEKVFQFLFLGVVPMC